MKAGWRVVPLGEVIELISGQHIDAKDYNTIGRGIGYLTGPSDFGAESPIISKWTESPKRFAEPGDILLTVKGSGVGKINRLRQERVAISRQIMAVRPKGIAPDFLFLLMASLSDYFAEQATGAAIPGISREDVTDLRVSLPPLGEQKRIVAVLDEAFEGLSRARAKAEANLADARELSSRHAAALFDRVAMEAKSTRRVAEIAAPEKGSIRTGPFGSQLLHSEFVESGVAVLGIDNAVKNEFQWAKRRFITEEKYKELSRYTVRPGDVIITIMGTCGRCAVVPDDIPKAINTKHLCCITLDQRLCVPDFLHAYFLYSPVARDYLASQVLGSIMDGLNMGIVKDLPVTLPSLNAQRDVVSAISEMRRSSLELEASYYKNIAELDTLRQALLQKAFSGKLT